MEGTFDQFIGVWEDHVPKFVCDKIIESFENAVNTSSNNFDNVNSGSNNSTYIFDGSTQFANKNLGRKDTAIMLNLYDTEGTMEVNQYLHSCFLHYINQFGSITQSPLISTDIKVQKTSPAGGYHVWHCENNNYQMAQRSLVWTMYLNDVEEGGETEFLYQSVRIKPKRGTVVIWPAHFTHIHRGNPPLSGDKYIATGWYINAVVAS